MSCRAIMYSNEAELSTVEKELIKIVEEQYSPNIVQKCHDIVNALDTLEVERVEKVEAATHKITEKNELQSRRDVCLKRIESLRYHEQIIKHLKEAKDNYAAGETAQAVSSLCDAEVALQNFREEFPKVEEKAKLMANLKVSVVVQRESLLYDLSKTWKELVELNVEKSEKCNTFTLKLSTFKSDESLEHPMKLMHDLHDLNIKMKAFCTNLMQELLIPITRIPSKLRITPSEKELLIVCEFFLSNPHEDGLDSSMEEICTVFEALHPCFLSISLDSNGFNVGKMISNIMASDFSEAVLKNYLRQRLQFKTKDVDLRKTSLSKLTQFQERLNTFDFVTSISKQELDMFLSCMNDISTNERCDHYLQQGHSLCVGDMKDCVKIQGLAELEKIAGQDVDPSHRQENKEGSREDDANGRIIPFEIAPCSISSNVQQLVALGREALEESLNCDYEDCANKLYQVVYSFFELYSLFIETYHSEVLAQNLPFISALLFNNYMYMAHHMQLWGFQYKLLAGRNGTALPEYCTMDVVEDLKQEGLKEWIRCVEMQQVALLDIINLANDFLGLSENENSDVERAFKQCGYQINHLNGVWNGVLTNSIRKDAIGKLANAVLGNVLQKILALEDLSIGDARKLSKLLVKSLLQIIIKIYRGEEPEGSDIEARKSTMEFVPNYLKSEELLVVLNLRLHAILERWADGKGPLAEVFTVTEMRGLIRMLFQNTEKRAKALSQIC